MKSFIFYFVLLATSTCYAQTLKLKKGQKFVYEYLAKNTSLSSIEFKNLRFESFAFEVLKVKPDGYDMKMQLLRYITYASHNPEIRDSKDLASVSGGKNIRDLINEILTQSPVTFTMDRTGKVINMASLDSLAAHVARQAELQKIPENKYGSPNAEFIKYGVQPAVFIRKAQLAFHRSNETKVDTTFRYVQAGKKDDTVTLKKETLVDARTGITVVTYKDSLSFGKILGRSAIHREKDAWWFALKSSTRVRIKPSMDLFEQFANETDFINYNTPSKKATRAVVVLDEWYGDSKGQLDLDAIATRKLDSLSNLVKPDDHEFNAAKIRLLGFYDYEGKMRLIEKTPVEYLLSDADVCAKALKAYQHRDTEGFVNALKMMFTKFALNGSYPMNVSHAADLVHFVICKDVVSSATSRADLLKIQEIVKAVQNLKISNLSSLFDGIDPFITATLANGPKEVESLASQRFKSVFDNYGRYRLLIYDRMTQLQVPDSIRSAYLDYSIEMFQNDIAEFSKAFEGHPQDAFFHRQHVVPQVLVLSKQLADAYYRKSILEPEHKIKYLQLASDYLPTQDEQIQDKYIISHEYPFLPERNYTELYLNAAGTKGISSQEMLTRYVDMVITEPDRYSILKEKYHKAYPSGDFIAFFNQALKEKLPATPLFNLKDRSGTEISSTSNKGKFQFIDFWGTWCGACVAEIDKIEDLHINNPVPDKLVVTTIACYDKKNLVDEFMEKKKFTYQVLMSDNVVEKNFKVDSYPTKVLLLPNGVYVLIPFSDDYKAVVKRYTNWEL